MHDPRKLAAAVLCVVAPATSFGCDPVFTVLTADAFNELQVGYVSNRNEEDTAREFAMSFRNGPIRMSSSLSMAECVVSSYSNPIPPSPLRLRPAFRYQRQTSVLASRPWADSANLVAKFTAKVASAAVKPVASFIRCHV